MVGVEVDSSGLHFRSHIVLVRRSGGDTVICFCMPSRTNGRAYSVGGGGGGGGKKGSWRKL